MSLKDGQVYLGWLVTYDEHRPVTGRWRATRYGVGMGYNDAEGLKRMIDVKFDEQQRAAALRQMEHKPNKGLWGGACNREACQKEPAYWYNTGTSKYYCAVCARLINDANRGRLPDLLCSPYLSKPYAP